MFTINTLKTNPTNMKSIRRLLRQLISGENRAPIIFPSASLSSLNEVVTGVNGPADLPATSNTSFNNLGYSSPPSSPVSIPPDRDEGVSYEAITIQSEDDNLPNNASSSEATPPPTTTSVDNRVRDVDGGEVETNPTDQLGELFFQRFPTPPTTALTENEDNGNDENDVEDNASPSCYLPSPPSSSLSESEDAQNNEESAEPTPGLDSTGNEGQNQEPQDISHGDGPSSSSDDDENSEANTNALRGPHGTANVSQDEELHDVTNHPENGILENLNVNVSNLNRWTEPYIAANFRFLYSLGVVPFQFCARAEERFQQHFVHTVTYLCLLMIAVTYSLYNLKLCIFQENFENNKLKFCVRLAFVAIVVCLPIDFAIVMWRFRANVASMIDTTKALAVICDNVVASNSTIKKAVVLFMIITTVLSGLLFPLLFTAAQSGFDATELLRYQAQDLGYALFAWKRGLNLSVFYDEYEGKMNWEIASMGLAWGTSSMIGCTYEYFVHEVPMWLAITMLGFTTCLSTALSKPELVQRYRGEIWIMYRLIKEYSRQIDLYFGGFLQFVHFNYLSLSTYLLYYTIIEEEIGWYSIVDIVNVGKMVTFYVASAKAADINDTLCTWIRENHRMDDVMYENGTVGVTAQVVIDDVSNNPIAIGSKLFLVNRSSIWKGISVIGSCFMFFVESAADQVVLNSN